MLRLGADREVLAGRVRRRICLACAHAARPRHSRRLRPAQERVGEAVGARATGIARDGDDGRMSLLGRIIVIVFALIVSSIAVGMAIAVGLLGPQWHAFSGDVGERVTFWGVAFFGSVLTGAVGLLPLLILIVLAEAFRIR